MGEINTVTTQPTIEDAAAFISDLEYISSGQPEIPRWRRAVVAASIVVLGLTAAGCNDGSSPEGNNTVETTATAPAPVVGKAGSVWDKNGCLADYVDVGDQAFGRQTNLCRSIDKVTTSTSFYYLYARGTDAANDWVEVIGSDLDGDAYWTYPKGEEHYRDPSGAIYIAEDNVFQPLDVSGTSSFLDGLEADFDAEGQASGEARVAALERQTYIPSTSVATPQVAQAPLQQEANTYQAAQTQESQAASNLAAANAQKAANAATLAQQEQLIIAQGKIDMLRIAAAPDCDFSLNACADF